jgi:site-specific DNA recombinase
LTPYYVIKKNKKTGAENHLVYYKCNYCAGANCNGNSTPRAKDKGVHEYFAELLSYFKLETDDLDALKMQLNKLVSAANKNSISDERNYQAEFDKIEAQIKTTKLRLGLGEIPKDIYEVTMEELTKRRLNIAANLNNSSLQLSNQEIAIETALKFIRNLSRTWKTGEVSVKRTIQKLIFPDGLVIDRVNKHYLTKTMNKVFAAIAGLTMSYDEKNKGTKLVLPILSLVVAGAGLEPATFGL